VEWGGDDEDEIKVRGGVEYISSCVAILKTRL